MLDFWEAMGWMIANQGGIRDTLFSNTLLVTGNTTVSINGEEVAQQIVSSQSVPANNKYTTLASLLAPFSFNFQPLSYITQGEWLRVLPSPGLQAALTGVGTAVTAAGVTLTGRSGVFYAGMGAIVSDDSFAARFVATPVVFPLVSGQDQTDLLTLASTSGTPGGFMALAADMCRLFWPPPCLVIVDAYAKDSQLQPTLRGVPLGA